MSDNENNKRSGCFLPITLALITLFGTLGAALIGNWDKIFPVQRPVSPQLSSSPVSSLPLVETPAPISPVPSPPITEPVENSELFDSKCPTESGAVYSDTSDPKIVYKRFPGSSSGIDMCMRVEFTEEILKQAGAYENARLMLLGQRANLVTRIPNGLAVTPLSPDNNYPASLIASLSGGSGRKAIQAVQSGDRHSAKLVVNGAEFQGEMTVVDASTANGVTKINLVRF
ncbi:MAG: hypothetical protein EDM05_68365 [Leptolyngbya sp. IPPAS B-1204]